MIEIARKQVNSYLDKHIKYYELTVTFMVDGNFWQRRMEESHSVSDFSSFD